MKKEEMITTHILDNPQGEAYNLTVKRINHGVDADTSDYVEQYTAICVEIGPTTYTDFSTNPNGVVVNTQYWKLKPIAKNFPGDCAKLKPQPEIIILSDNPNIRTHIDVSIEKIARFRDITVWDKEESDKQAQEEQAKKIADKIQPIKDKLSLDEISQLVNFIKTGRV